jgi:hypothetical protein
MAEDIPLVRQFAATDAELAVTDVMQLVLSVARRMMSGVDKGKGNKV